MRSPPCGPTPMWCVTSADSLQAARRAGAVRDRQTGRFIGDIGFADFHRPIEPSIIGVPEAGWVLASWAHGQGIASEALSAALAWLDRSRFRGKVVCLVGDENRASLRVARKHGFQSTAFIDAWSDATHLLTCTSKLNGP